MVLGHEIAGTVAEVGPDVAGLAPGTGRRQSKPALRRLPLLPGGLQQRMRRHAFHRQRHALPPRAGRLPQSLTVDAAQAVPVAGRLAMAEAALAEPLAVCLHAAAPGRAAPGKRVLVTGCGPIGALVHRGGAARGARPRSSATDIAA